MTPEERFERIEKNLDVYAQFLVQSAERLSTIEHLQQQLTTNVANHDAQLAKLESHMAKLTETMNRLGNIVIRHEERLDSLEEDNPE